jgi:hypothetical protein
VTTFCGMEKKKRSQDYCVSGFCTLLGLS